MRIINFNHASIQDAVDACELMSEASESDFQGVSLILPPGDFLAESVLIKKHVNLIGNNKTQIGTLTYRPSSSTLGPRKVLLKDLFIQNLNILAETAPSSGIFYPDMMDNQLVIDSCELGNVSGNRINSIKHMNCYLDGSSSIFHYCSNISYVEGKSASVEFHADDSVSNPPTGGSAGALYFINSFSNGLIDLYKDGGSSSAFMAAYGSYLEFLTLNSNCDVAMRGGSSLNKDNLSLLGSNNNFVEQESFGMYSPAVPSNYSVAPKFIKEALDELAARPHPDLSNVDNTSDMNKPVSIAQAAADAASIQRANHTGSQLASTISNFSSEVKNNIVSNPRTIMRSQASHIAGKVAGIYALASADAAAVSGTGTLYVQSLIHINSSDYASINNSAVKLRIKATCAINNVAPTGNFTFGLYPISRPASSGGAGLNIYTLGTVVSGSNDASFIAPAADSMAVATSSEFDLPADGFYALGVLTTSTVANSSLVHLIADLQVINA
jgi:hypothetical protein